MKKIAREINKIAELADRINEIEPVVEQKLNIPKKATFYKLGIMQGRLSPRLNNNKYQYFPKDTWEQEFELATKLGFDYIELVVDDTTLFTPSYVKRVKELTESTGVATTALCLDTLLHNKSKYDDTDDLLCVIERSKGLKIGSITLPIIEENAIKNERDIMQLIGLLKETSILAAKNGINLNLELDLNCLLLDILFEKIRSLVDCNYNIGTTLDLGNLYFYGLTINDIIKVKHVHVKDRNEHRSCLLGEGLVDFSSLLKLTDINVGYDERLDPPTYEEQHYTLQGVRGEVFDSLDEEVKIVKKQKEIFEGMMERWSYKSRKEDYGFK